MKFDIEQYCKTNLQRVSVTSSDQITAICPWCEKYGAFYIDKKSGQYICFKCDQRGRRLAGVIAQVEDLTFKEAEVFILRKSVQFRRKKTPESLLSKIKALRGIKHKEKNRKINFSLPKEFIPVYKKKKWRMPLYLKERGISKDTAKFFELGFCEKGRYSNRIILPIVCPNGKSFEARAINNFITPKTLGPVGADKSKLLFGWNQIEKNTDFVLVEGPFDVLKAYQHGASVLGLGGKNLSSAQLSLLCNWPVDCSVTVMLDPEEIEASYKVALQLSCYFEFVYIARLPENIDPGDSILDQFWEAYHVAKRYNGERNILLKTKVEMTKKQLFKSFR